MLSIQRDANGQIILQGRFDASQEAMALDAFNKITETCIVDCSKLEYISSSGIGVLIATQKRLTQNQQRLQLQNLSPHIAEIFKFAGLDTIFYML